VSQDSKSGTCDVEFDVGEDDPMREWRWPLVALVALLAIAFGTWRTCRLIDDSRREARAVVADVGKAAREVAEGFKTGRITNTFVAAIPKLAPGGPLLELASFEATETFTRADERAILFDLIPLGTNVTEIRVPVTYRYHLQLSDPWQLEVRDKLCLVRAPRIRASLPPAIHTDRLERRSERAWLRGGVEQQMEQLERSITPTLSQRAVGAEHLALVREPCRRRVAEFVRAWLLREDQWRDDRFTAVTVLFADELPRDPSTPPPTLAKD
jgi:hypothetical protein